MNRKSKKLLKGIALFTTFWVSNDWIGGADGLDNIQKHIITFLSFIPFSVADIIATLIALAISVSMLYCCISGMFRIFTFHLNLPTFEKFEE